VTKLPNRYISGPGPDGGNSPESPLSVSEANGWPQTEDYTVNTMSNASSRWRLLAVLCYSVPAIGQISGRFFLEKHDFALGEPVFLNFEASNSGRESKDIIHANPYSFCAGYQIHFSSDPSPTSSCALLPGGGSCASSSITLEPGATHSERVLINYEHQIVKPGDYEVDVTRHLSYGPGGGQLPLKFSAEFHERLRFVVNAKAQFGASELKTWVDQLQSLDAAKRAEAARTLASLAPHSLESTLLGFIEDLRLRYFAPLAMHRLNTPQSNAGLAEILRRTQLGTPENIEAAEFLASTADPQWYPLLLELARKRPGDGFYLYPAAESGGDRAVRVLIDSVHSGRGVARRVAISALGYTGSRAAVPVLLDLLGDSDLDPDSSSAALYALRQLTRRTVNEAKDSPQFQSRKWREWWSRHAGDARIYKRTECTEFYPLGQN
jgi:hypothetical protein